MAERQLISMLPKLSQVGIIATLESILKEQGSPSRLWLGTVPLYLAADPESLQKILRDNVKNYRKPDLYYNAAKITLGNGLITSDGDLWLKQRRLIQPYLHRKALVNISQVMLETIEKELAQWQILEDTSQDFGALMASLSMSLIINTLFGTDILSIAEREEIAQAVKKIVDYTATRGYLMFIPRHMPILGENRFKAAYKLVYEAILRLIELRRKEGASTDNLIGMLLHAVDSENNHQMSEKQLFDETMTIFLAGYESISTTLTWYWYLLTEHPEIYQAVQDEIDSVLQGRIPELDDYPALNLAQMSLMEAMRLYPPSPFVPREALAEDTLGKFKIKRGDVVFAFFYGVHRNPKIWDEPEQFNPLRFNPEQEKTRSRFAYLPFSAGQRQCVGNEFAMLEGIWIIAMIMQRYKLELVAGQTIKPRVRATLHPANGVKICFTPR